MKKNKTANQHSGGHGTAIAEVVRRDPAVLNAADGQMEIDISRHMKDLLSLKIAAQKHGSLKPRVIIGLLDGSGAFGVRDTKGAVRTWEHKQSGAVIGFKIHTKTNEIPGTHVLEVIKSFERQLKKIEELKEHRRE